MHEPNIFVILIVLFFKFNWFFPFNYVSVSLI